MPRFYYFTNGHVTKGKYRVKKVNRDTFNFETIYVPLAVLTNLLQENKN